MDSESLRDEKVKVLKAIPALERRGRRARTIPRLPPGARRRGRFAGRDVRRRPAPHRFVAVAGRPVLHPRGKVPAGDVPRRSSSACGSRQRVFPTAAPLPNYFRFRIVPRQTIAFGVTAMDEADQMIGQRAELVASRQPGADERAAYERVLTDALDGRRHAVCADGLRRRGVAHRRSGAGDEHAGSRIRAGDLGPRRSRGATSPLPEGGPTRRQKREPGP